MKAIVCHAFGPVEDLDYCDQPDPVAPDRGVVIRAQAIGVNYPDGLMVQGLYQMKPDTPFVPGMEMAGIVESVGASATRFEPGDRVAVFSSLGGYAEKLAVEETHVISLPDRVPAADGCALLCAYGTSHHALRQRADLKPGETLAVLGAAGATGIAAIQIGKAMGARVIAIASSAEKREACWQAGADEVIGYETLREDLKRATGGRGCDVIFDPVGGAAFEAATRSMARNGRLLVVGFASGEISKFPVNLALLKEYAVVGVFWGNFIANQPALYATNMAELFKWHAQGHVRPVVDTVAPLKDAGAVLARILGRDIIGKAILTP